MTELLQRICWNTNGWTAPSGGKFGMENSYPGKLGFGHEEWNFNLRDSVDGFVYGHIYRDYESLGKRTSPGPHDIYFWSRQSPSAAPVLVGVYRDALFVPRAERLRVTSDFDQRGILARRAAEISQLGLPSRALQRMGSPMSQLRGGGFAILRVREINIDVLRTPIRLSVAFRGKSMPRLIRYYQFAELRTGAAPKYPSATRVSKPSEENEGAPRVDAYWRTTTSGNALIVKHEEILRSKLIAFLRATNPPPILASEDGHTDLTAERHGHTCLMELKTCKHVSSKIAARAALGQLLYYAFHKGSKSPFTNSTPPDSLCIVLDESPDQDTRAWLAGFSARFKIDVDLVWNAAGGFDAAFRTTPFF